MRIPSLHRWPRTTKAAVELQRRLADHVQLKPIIAPVRLLGGIDLAISPDGTHLWAGIVVWDAGSRTVVESRVARVVCRFPYVPGLLSFRETPGVISVARKLCTWPDAFLCDGQGLAHPRRFGLACHIGLWLNTPTIGCAKSRLCGEFAEPGEQRGERSPLMLDAEQVGVVLRTRDAVRPLFVSPGHLCDIESAVNIALNACAGYRLPEPARLAHQLVTRARSGPRAR